MSRDLDAKQAAFDAHAAAAVDYLIDWICRDRDALVALARGRHVEGHYRYGDRLMYEFTQDVLLAEAAQEIADAIVYLHLRVARGGPCPSSTSASTGSASSPSVSP